MLHELESIDGLEADRSSYSINNATEIQSLQTMRTSSIFSRVIHRLTFIQPLVFWTFSGGKHFF